MFATGASASVPFLQPVHLNACHTRNLRIRERAIFATVRVNFFDLDTVRF